MVDFSHTGDLGNKNKKNYLFYFRFFKKITTHWETSTAVRDINTGICNIWLSRQRGTIYIAVKLVCCPGTASQPWIIMTM